MQRDWNLGYFDSCWTAWARSFLEENKKRLIFFIFKIIVLYKFLNTLFHNIYVAASVCMDSKAYFRNSRHHTPCTKTARSALRIGTIPRQNSCSIAINHLALPYQKELFGPCTVPIWIIYGWVESIKTRKSTVHSYSTRRMRIRFWRITRDTWIKWCSNKGLSRTWTRPILQIRPLSFLCTNRFKNTHFDFEIAEKSIFLFRHVFSQSDSVYQHPRLVHPAVKDIRCAHRFGQ